MNSTQASDRWCALDGMFFQRAMSGIGRVWLSIMQEWSRSGFAAEVLILDRDSSAPKLDGFEYEPLPVYDLEKRDTDPDQVEAVLKQHGIELFLSTFYTTPLTVPSLLLLHDFIPEALKWDFSTNKELQDRLRALEYASQYISVSHNTARELKNFYPKLADRPTQVVHHGVDHKLFTPRTMLQQAAFRDSFEIRKPFFLLIGPDFGYKNAELFYRALQVYEKRHEFEVLLVGGQIHPNDVESLNSIHPTKKLRLTDEELACAYSAAYALVYPSLLEGFGLPVLEAMACRCPVITTALASLPEVCGEAALFIQDEGELHQAWDALRDFTVRHNLCERGLNQAAGFQWQQAAESYQQAICNMRSSLAGS